MYCTSDDHCQSTVTVTKCKTLVTLGGPKSIPKSIPTDSPSFFVEWQWEEKLEIRYIERISNGGEYREEFWC